MRLQKEKKKKAQTHNSFNFRLGALFALIMTFITFLCKRYLHEVQTSEMYMTAQRTVKTGLVASAIVSSWTWAATLLTSTEVAYKYGVSVRCIFVNNPKKKF